VSDHLLARREVYVRDLARIAGIEYIPGSSLVGAQSAELRDRVPSVEVMMSAAHVYCVMRERAETDKQPFPRSSGGARDELLAAIIFHECNKVKCYVRRDISNMMNLRSDGMEHGYEQLATLAKLGSGYFTLETEDESRESKIRYYYGQILAPIIDKTYVTVPSVAQSIASRHMSFISDVIRCANANFIGMQSQLQSKIVGAIWFIITSGCYRVTANIVDAKSGGIKKTTFTKFANAIYTSPVLMAIARDYGFGLDQVVDHE
jgi:hypothetical protein